MGKNHCDRCGISLKGEGFRMSYFNTDICCLDCLDKESKHPDYELAKRVEHEAVKRGDYNFPGIGKPFDL